MYISVSDSTVFNTIGSDRSGGILAWQVGAEPVAGDMPRRKSAGLMVQISPKIKSHNNNKKYVDNEIAVCYTVAKRKG